ncbi:MAG: cell division protein FtsQ/DivIB [Verrucomicrobiota bacterium]
MNWFRRPLSRRRRGEEFDLAVRLRADASARQRRRFGARVMGFLLLAGMLGLGGALTVALAREKWLHQVEALALRDLGVATDGLLTREEVLAVARLREGLNLLALDLPDVQARLLRHPRIAAAELYRELPGTLRLSLRERFPLARVKPPSNSPVEVYHLLDESGRVMLPLPRGGAPAESLEAEAQLPLLLGVDAAALTAGAQAAEPRVLGALRFLSAFEESPLAALTDVLSVDLSRPGELQVLTAHGSSLVFALRDAEPGFRVALRLWEAVHRESLRSGRVIGSLDLSVTNNAPLRWLVAGTNQVEQPRPARVRRRPVRRHV